MDKVLLTISEFCSIFGVGRTRAYRLIKRGKIRKVKIGVSTRIVRKSADEWLAGLGDGPDIDDD